MEPRPRGVHDGEQVAAAQHREAQSVAVLDILLDVVAKEYKVALVLGVFADRDFGAQ